MGDVAETREDRRPPEGAVRPRGRLAIRSPSAAAISGDGEASISAPHRQLRRSHASHPSASVRRAVADLSFIHFLSGCSRAGARCLRGPRGSGESPNPMNERINREYPFKDVTAVACAESASCRRHRGVRPAASGRHLVLLLEKRVCWCIFSHPLSNSLSSGFRGCGEDPHQAQVLRG